MKLKTVPKIRTDCISCNGDSSVRIREGSKKVVGPVKQPAVATGFKRNHWSDEFALPHVDVAVDSENTAEVELLGWGVLGLPQREVFGDNAGKRISLYGNKKVVGPVKQPAVATGFKRNHWSDEFALPHVDVAVDSEDTAEVELLGWGVLECRREKSLEIMQGQGFLCVAIKKSFRRSVFPYIRYSSCFWTGIRNYVTT